MRWLKPTRQKEIAIPTEAALWFALSFEVPTKDLRVLPFAQPLRPQFRLTRMDFLA